MAHPDANRKMHYVIEKSNKILGEEKEKTEGVHTAYTHPEHSKCIIEGEVKEKGKGQGSQGQGNQSFFLALTIMTIVVITICIQYIHICIQ